MGEGETRRGTRKERRLFVDGVVAAGLTRIRAHLTPIVVSGYVSPRFRPAYVSLSLPGPLALLQSLCVLFICTLSSPNIRRTAALCARGARAPPVQACQIRKGAGGGIAGESRYPDPLAYLTPLLRPGSPTVASSSSSSSTPPPRPPPHLSPTQTPPRPPSKPAPARPKS